MNTTPSPAQDPRSQSVPAVWTAISSTAPALAGLLPFLLQLNTVQTIVLGAVCCVALVMGGIVQIVTSRGASTIAVAEASATRPLVAGSTVVVTPPPAAIPPEAP